MLSYQYMPVPMFGRKMDCACGDVSRRRYEGGRRWHAGCFLLFLRCRASPHNRLQCGPTPPPHLGRAGHPSDTMCCGGTMGVLEYGKTFIQDFYPPVFGGPQASANFSANNFFHNRFRPSPTGSILGVDPPPRGTPGHSEIPPSHLGLVRFSLVSNPPTVALGQTANSTHATLSAPGGPSPTFDLQMVAWRGRRCPHPPPPFQPEGFSPKVGDPVFSCTKACCLFMAGTNFFWLLAQFVW